MSRLPADVLLVGSVPLGSAEEVFATCGGAVGDMAAALPDGETGDRTIWVVYQAYRVFDEHPQLNTVQRPGPAEGKPDWAPTGLHDIWKFEVKDGVEDLRFDDLKYASVAEESYATFKSLRDAGDIPPDLRFQVCLPLPESGLGWFFHDPALLARVIPAYEAAIVREVERIADVVPPEDLSVQFDVCWELLDIEGIFPWAVTTDPFERYCATVSRVAPAVPEPALLGFHLCYADLGHVHMKEPEDLSVCVRMANAAVENAGRRVDFFHMPVPRDRSDDAYFTPLSDLNIGEAKVFLGLVHYTDGLEGTLDRLNVARRHLSGFGIATECGFGRRPPETVRPLLEIHRGAAEALAPSRT